MAQIILNLENQPIEASLKKALPYMAGDAVAEAYISPAAYVSEVSALRVMSSSITGMESGTEQDDSTF